MRMNLTLVTDLDFDEDEMCCQQERDCLNYVIVKYITRCGIE